MEWNRILKNDVIRILRAQNQFWSIETHCTRLPQ